MDGPAPPTTEHRDGHVDVYESYRDKANNSKAKGPITNYPANEEDLPTDTISRLRKERPPVVPVVPYAPNDTAPSPIPDGAMAKCRLRVSLDVSPAQVGYYIYMFITYMFTWMPF